jgi:hypothetical protein
MTLCVPFYVLYFVYGKCESTLLKLFFTVDLGADLLAWSLRNPGP